MRDFYERHRQALIFHLVAGQRGAAAGDPRADRQPARAGAGGIHQVLAQHRVQVLGNAEMHFLKSVPEADRNERLARLLSYRVPCIVFSSRLSAGWWFSRDGGAVEPSGLSEPAGDDAVHQPRFTLLLDVLCAPQGTDMGNGEPYRDRGDHPGAAGVGKSECVLGLIERGYSLVADDITHLARQRRAACDRNGAPAGFASSWKCEDRHHQRG